MKRTDQNTAQAQLLKVTVPTRNGQGCFEIWLDLSRNLDPSTNRLGFSDMKTVIRWQFKNGESQTVLQENIEIISQGTADLSEYLSDKMDQAYRIVNHRKLSPSTRAIVQDSLASLKIQVRDAQLLVNLLPCNLSNSISTKFCANKSCSAEFCHNVLH
jgi:hypothetical protein